MPTPRCCCGSRGPSCQALQLPGGPLSCLLLAPVQRGVHGGPVVGRGWGGTVLGGTLQERPRGCASCQSWSLHGACGCLAPKALQSGRSGCCPGSVAGRTGSQACGQALPGCPAAKPGRWPGLQS